MVMRRLIRLCSCAVSAAVAFVGACAGLSCLFQTPELHLAQPWCSNHTPAGGRCWDFDHDAEVDRDWTGLLTPNRTFASAAPPAHPASRPNAFQARIEPPSVPATTLRQTEPLPSVAKFSFAMRFDPKECVRADLDPAPPYPQNTLVAYVSSGTGADKVQKIPVLFMFGLKDAQTFVAGYFSAAEDAGDVFVDERHKYTVRPSPGRWLEVRFDVVQSDKKTAGVVITVDSQQASFKSVPLTGSESTITVGLGLAANGDPDSGFGYSIQSCNASFDNVTLELR